MKKYIVGLFLILLIVGCQQQAPEESPESTEQNVVDVPAQTEETTEETQTEETPVKPVEEVPTGGDVRILGNGRFDPEEIKVKAGAAVVFKNNAGKTITLQLWEGRKVIDTAVIKDGNMGEIIFDKVGLFEVITLEYVTSISVTVE
ncbi:hypothetical protein ISS05_02710 [Candidatus Woesearchaeota archaeon]|nr:hypothetical protein [Candidatus Woesearchaeota archaeon]